MVCERESVGGGGAKVGESGGHPSHHAPVATTTASPRICKTHMMTEWLDWMKPMPVMVVAVVAMVCREE